MKVRFLISKLMSFGFSDDDVWVIKVTDKTLNSFKIVNVYRDNDVGKVFVIVEKLGK